MTEDKIKKSGFKKYLLIGGGGFIALIAVLAFVGELLFRNEIKACNKGGEEECKNLIQNNTHLDLDDFNLVTNPIFKNLYNDYELDKANKKRIEEEEKALQKNKSLAKNNAQKCLESPGIICLSIKTEFLDNELLASVKPLIDQQNKIKEEKEAADAKFKAEGWWEPKKGIFVRWCKDASYRYPAKGDCPRTDSYLDTVWRLMVWCRDRRCGDIYAKINLFQGSDGPVIGWTNDTAYGDYGQKVILTFQTNSNASYARLVEFSTY